MKVSEAIVKCLEAENVNTVFGYPGAAVIPLYEALSKSTIRHILVRHEQAAGHSAAGYSKSSGKTGVCIVTSGPGATNIITAVANAYMDSIPMVIITGQVNLSLIGKDVFQEADITGSTEPFTKHNYLVKKAEDIPKILKEAFYIASTGRPGPVLVDIPVDLQYEDIDLKYPEEVNIRGYKPNNNGHKLQIKKALEKIRASKRPLICVGGGVSCSNARNEFRELVSKSKIPVIHTLMGKDSIDATSPFYIGLIGSHGYSYANKAILKSDLLIFIGSRLADRATIALKQLSEDTTIIHIDIDPAEIGKTQAATIPIVGDAKKILEEINKVIEPVNTDKWIQELEDLKLSTIDNNVNSNENTIVSPKYVLNTISNIDDPNLILVTDVGQNQIWSARNFKVVKDRLFITSGGLGTMGFSLPAAIGAKVGSPDKKVIATMGDGGFQMSLFELATIVQSNVNITIILFNNSGLGMVREIQRNTYSNTFGVDIPTNPDFVKLVEAYGIKATRVSSNEEFEATFKASLDYKGPQFIECIVSPLEKTLQ